MGKWHERADAIRGMVAAGMTDNEIGAVYGASSKTVCIARKELGIPTVFKRKPSVFWKPEPPPPLVGEVYIDADGLTVTRYPARYGAAVQGVTARPRRS